MKKEILCDKCKWHYIDYCVMRCEFYPYRVRRCNSFTPKGEGREDAGEDH